MILDFDTGVTNFIMFSLNLHGAVSLKKKNSLFLGIRNLLHLKFLDEDLVHKANLLDTRLLLCGFRLLHDIYLLLDHFNQ